MRHVEIVQPKQPRPVSPRSGQLVSPNRNQRDIQAIGTGFIYDLHDTIEVFFIGTLRVVLDERLLAERARRGHALKLRQNHCLDHSESLHRARVQIVARFFPRCVMNQLPCRISQPEEWTAIFRFQIMSARMNNDRRQVPRLTDNGSEDQPNRK